MMATFGLLLLFLAVGTAREICNSDFVENNTNSSDVIALILARGGSKGIPRKNLAKINGVSLIGRTIALATKSGVFHQIWVSTEDTEIANESIKHGALVHNRPRNLAEDGTPSIDAVFEFINVHRECKKLALIQCTSVFLNIDYLREAYSKFVDKECVFSVTRTFKLRWMKVFTGDLIPVNFDPNNRPRRQDWSGELIENGMFYFASRNLLSNKLFQNNQCEAVEIPQKDSLEIDSNSDLDLARLINKSGNEPLNIN